MRTPDPRYPSLRILSSDDTDDRLRLAYLLHAGTDIIAGPEILDDLAALRAFSLKPNLPRSTIEHLLTGSGLGTLAAARIVAEFGYIDRDTNIAYTELHARAFRDYPRRTVRLHLFEGEIDYSDLFDESRTSGRYLGYCVLPMTQPRTVGRTVLAPPRDSGLMFFPCQETFQTNLAGSRLEVAGTAFIEQDGRVAACATAALWMSTAMLGRRFGVPVRSTAEITQLATEHSLPSSGRGASPGLEIDQVLWCLNEMGFDPLVHPLRGDQGSRELIYTYIESGIPVILVIYLPHAAGGGGYHAVTAVGHSYDPEVSPPAGKEYLSAADWCPRLVLHDDQMGPYILAGVGPPVSGTSGRPSLLVNAPQPYVQLNKTISDWYRGAVIYYAIAPFPPRHNLRAEEATAKGWEILSAGYELWRGTGIEFPKPAVLRTYFSSANEFKRRWAPDTWPLNPPMAGNSGELAHWHRGSAYPRYVWVTELGRLEHRASRQPAELLVEAEVVIDPTSSPDAIDFVTLHIPKLFFRMVPDQKSTAYALANPVAQFPNDEPHPPLIRLETARL